MEDKFVSERNLKFLLHEVLAAEDLSRLAHFQDHDRQDLDMMLNTALRISEEMLFPAFREMDQQTPKLDQGQVRVHPLAREFMRQSGEGGWIAATFSYDEGGLQIPTVLDTACQFVFMAANLAAAAYPGLTKGAAHLLLSYGSEELKQTYVPPMIAGEWQGTMALTEPQAGSSLSDLTVSAQPSEEGHYLISGQKIFISAGDHDGVDNVVHLMLARIKGAPAGVKGISLFVVPKLRPEGGGLLPNDLHTAGLFHKLGYRGCPIVQLSMGEAGDCRGWLLGKPNQGLSYMFQMMNEARISVGLQAAAVASGAYYASLKYALEREQGRPVESKDPNQPPVAIIRHPDVKRLLLFQRAVVEGSLALLMQVSLYADLAVHGGEQDKQRAAQLLDLLTPVAKSYPAEMGIASTSAGLQILGGYGYTEEFPLEQYFRDMRIHAIHEGTTGIQALDLLGRKVRLHGGRALEAFEQEVRSTMEAAEGVGELAGYAVDLGQALELLRRATTAKLSLMGQGRVAQALADACLYLEMFGLAAVAWQWLKQGVTAAQAVAKGITGGEAAFYQGKLATMRYFFHYELPKSQGLARRLLEDDALTVDLPPEYFAD
ncbi:MAG: acyl-CoA dehydrogenase [Proteobacteria bacterium]|nr:acyl-CoA dehydrogenase [Pseudomonadota bacterium]MBU4385325.1 acyl-CoA dehydrogenase [Pseudomonadota bacterium]MCG2764545.1 acyl-CoA dehydrogenase [Desulfarculaceae bacterium]